MKHSILIASVVAYLTATLALEVFAQNKEMLLVLNKADNTLSFIDPLTLETVEKIATGDGPHEICVSHDGTTAYVANYGQQKPGNSLSVIDVKNKKEIRRIDLGALFRPHGLVFSGGMVYGTAEGSRCVFRYNPEKDKTDWIMGTGKSISHMLAWNPNLEKAYTADILSNSVSVVHFNKPPLPEFIKSIAVGAKPEAIAISPDMTEVWVGHNDEGTISIIDSANDFVKETFAVGKMPIRILFSKDGNQAFISDPPAESVIVIDVKSRKVVKRIATPGGPVGIALSPDGKFACVALTKTNEIAMIDTKSLAVIKKGKTGQNPDGISWI